MEYVSVIVAAAAAFMLGAAWYPVLSKTLDQRIRNKM